MVVANFRPGWETVGRIRIPYELAQAAGLTGGVQVRLVLDRNGARNVPIRDQTVQALKADGFPVSIPDQTAFVYVIETTGK